MKTRALFVMALMVSSLWAQKAESKPPEVESSPIGISTGLPFYAVDDAFKLKIRDLEYAANQIEIEIQTLRAQIEEDKAKEAEIWKQVSRDAADYADHHKIDPARYDFDTKEIKFPKKKKP